MKKTVLTVVLIVASGVCSADQKTFESLSMASVSQLDFGIMRAQTIMVALAVPIIEIEWTGNEEMVANNWLNATAYPPRVSRGVGGQRASHG